MNAPTRSLFLVVLGCLAAACATGPGPECAKLRPLNEAVRAGTLTDDQRSCLVRRLSDAQDPDRQVVSRLLVEHARKQDDGGQAWAERAAAHVDAFPSDVVVFVHLANYHQRRGPEGAEQSMRFAQRGLAQLQRSPAATSAERRAFHDLTKALAIAAEMLAPPEAPVENRERTARYARDWYIAATAVSLRTDRALAMCRNAGASEAFCTGASQSMHGGQAADVPGDTDD